MCDNVKLGLLAYCSFGTMFTLCLFIIFIYLCLLSTSRKLLNCKVGKHRRKRGSKEESATYEELYTILSQAMAEAYDSVTGYSNKEVMKQAFFTKLSEKTDEDGDHLYEEVVYAAGISNGYEEISTENIYEYATIDDKARISKIKHSWGSRDHLRFLNEKKSSSDDEYERKFNYLEAKCFYPASGCPKNLIKLCSGHVSILNLFF
jgi:hypothetical protein